MHPLNIAASYSAIQNNTFPVVSATVIVAHSGASLFALKSLHYF